MTDRFRLVYLKSAGLGNIISEEAISLSSEPKEFYKKSVSQDHSPTGGFAFQEVLRQAEADLKHPDPKVRMLAVKYYLEKSHLSVTMPLLQEMLSDPDSGVRAEALSSLIRFKNRIVSPFLKKHLKDSDPMVRIIALRGMFQFKEKMDLNLLMQFLSDESSLVRRKVATLLGWSQMEGTLPILREMSKDEDSKVRKAALFSLLTLYPEEGERSLMEALSDRDADNRRWVREYLDKLIEKPLKRATVFQSK